MWKFCPERQRISGNSSCILHFESQESDLRDGYCTELRKKSMKL
jgi:hypothetical protein